MTQTVSVDEAQDKLPDLLALKSFSYRLMRVRNRLNMVNGSRAKKPDAVKPLLPSILAYHIC
jgi:hypothetical protein